MSNYNYSIKIPQKELIELGVFLQPSELLTLSMIIDLIRLNEDNLSKGKRAFLTKSYIFKDQKYYRLNPSYVKRKNPLLDLGSNNNKWKLTIDKLIKSDLIVKIKNKQNTMRLSDKLSNMLQIEYHFEGCESLETDRIPSNTTEGKTSKNILEPKEKLPTLKYSSSMVVDEYSTHTKIDIRLREEESFQIEEVLKKFKNRWKNIEVDLTKEDLYSHFNDFEKPLLELISYFNNTIDLDLYGIDSLSQILKYIEPLEILTFEESVF